VLILCTSSRQHIHSRVGRNIIKKYEFDPIYEPFTLFNEEPHIKLNV